MKKGKIALFFGAGAALCVCLSGCLFRSWDTEALKDAAIGLFNDAVEFIGSLALTNDLWLRGKRELGADSYNGSYAAQYERYSGEEYLFGGTSLELRGREMRLCYTLEVRSGSASLRRIGGEKETVIAETAAEGVYEFPLEAGDNFIILKGRILPEA